MTREQAETAAHRLADTRETPIIIFRDGEKYFVDEATTLSSDADLQRIYAVAHPHDEELDLAGGMFL